MMKARSRNIQHPSGVNLQTPLLIPSFSSKGFGWINKGYSKVYDYLNTYKKEIKEPLLISAYDLHYGHIPEATKFSIPERISFIDSGGYEIKISENHSLNSELWGKYKHWNQRLQEDTLVKWPKEFPSIIINYDRNRRALENQIGLAKEQFNRFQHLYNDFLIRPEHRNETIIPLEKIINNIKALRHFNIIGFTEKELGRTIIARMKSVSKIRNALDENGIHAPIHVFGSLDPISSVLLFMSGAEIFDGLSWLKYSYQKNSANNQSYNQGIKVELKRQKQLMENEFVKHNIHYLKLLKNSMIRYTETNKFSEYDSTDKGMGATFESIYADFLKHPENENAINEKSLF